MLCSLTLLLLTVLSAQDGVERSIAGVVIDETGTPIGGVQLAEFWSFPDPRAEGGAIEPLSSRARGDADDEGRFSVPVRSPGSTVLLALDAARERGAFCLAPAPGEPASQTVVLHPLRAVRGRLDVSTPGAAPSSMGVWVKSPGSSFYVAWCETTSFEYAFRLPPGRYELSYSRGDRRSSGVITIPFLNSVDVSGGSDLDLGTTKLDLPRIAELKGVVLDESGEPVSNCEVATLWTMMETQGDSPSQNVGVLGWAFGGVKTDAKGTFILHEEVHGSDRMIPLIAMDFRHGVGAIAPVLSAGDQDSTALHLRPLITVSGRLSVEGEEKPSLPWSNVEVSLEPGSVRIASSTSQKARFTFRLPPGAYSLSAYGTDTDTKKIELKLDGSQAEVDLGVVVLSPTALYHLRDRPAPEWNVASARGLHPETSIASFRGKWLLIEFWGYS